MKTYSEFILEAEPIKWNSARLKGSGKSPADTAGQRLTSLSRQMRGANPQQMVNIANRIIKMKAGIANADEKFKTKDPRPETRATTAQRTGRMRKNTGYASKPADTRGSTGSLSGIASPAGEGSGSRVAGRYGDLRTGSPNNIGSTQTNTGRGYSGRKFGKSGNL